MLLAVASGTELWECAVVFAREHGWLALPVGSYTASSRSERTAAIAQGPA